MFKFLRKHRTLVMISVAFCVIGMVLFQVGGSSLQSSPQDTIIKVNGHSISQTQFNRIYNQLLRQQKDQTSRNPQEIMRQALNGLIREEVFFEEAEKYGIEITDQELRDQVASIPAFQKDGRFDPQSYVQVVGQVFGTNPKTFEANFKKDVSTCRLNRMVSSAVQIPDDEFQGRLRERLQTEKDPKVKKELEKDPEKFREELKNKELNLVFSDWINQLNSHLKVSIVSSRFQRQLEKPGQ